MPRTEQPSTDRPRYRRISTRMWGDGKFRRLSKPQPNGQSLWQFLLTGPQTRAVPGLFAIGEAGLAEMLEWPLTGFRKVWRELAQLKMVKADWRARLVWIPNAVHHNPPESPNVVRSWRTTIDDMPECSLKAEAIAALRTQCEAFGEGFAKAFDEASGGPSRKPSSKPSPNQDQEQEERDDGSHPSRKASTNGGRLVPPTAAMDAQVADRATRFLERYPGIYERVRHGARYAGRQKRDFPYAVELVVAWPDDSRLDTMAELFLRMDAKEANNIPGTPGQFLHMAPECDARLRENSR